MTSMGWVFAFLVASDSGYLKNIKIRNCQFQVFEKIWNHRTVRSRYLKKFRFKELLVPGISKSSKNC
jgi:hypothetical protein